MDKFVKREMEPQDSTLSLKRKINPLEYREKDKAQKSDVGSPSDLSKIVDIPAKFHHIGGNTDLANAQVILLGELHISQHHEDIVDFINTYAHTGDIVLVEGYQANTKLLRLNYVLQRAATLGNLAADELALAKLSNLKLREWTNQGVIRPFRKEIEIYGWDDNETSKKQFSLQKKFSDETINTYSILSTRRDKYMIETINNMRNNFPNKKLFVIAGKGHVVRSLEKVKDQTYIALTPKYEPTDKEVEDSIRRRKAQASPS